MKTKWYFGLLLTCLVSPRIQAQPDKLIFGDKSTIQRVTFKDCYLEDSVRIGRCRFSVSYRLIRKRGENDYAQSLLKLMVGDGISSQIDRSAYLNSLTLTAFRKGATSVDPAVSAQFDEAGGHSNLFVQLIRREKEQTLEVFCADMQTDNRTRVYTEPVPKMEWVVENTTDTVCTYACLKATARFRGRTWTAWFTTEMPVGLGPWKLAGLPGLILKATDETGEYAFECVNISAKQEPLFLYDYPNKQVVTRDKYLKYEKNSYLSPRELLEGGQDVRIMEQRADGSLVDLKESWTAPYYPIERE